MLQDVQLKCDLVDVDDTLDNEYTHFLVDGSILPIHFTGLTSGSQIITNYTTDLHVSRSLTRLKSVFVTLMRTPTTRVRSESEANLFFHPMGEGNAP